jgi:hypothetical protein
MRVAFARGFKEHLKNWICLFGVEVAQALLHALRCKRQHGSELLKERKGE